MAVLAMSRPPKVNSTVSLSEDIENATLSSKCPAQPNAPEVFILTIERYYIEDIT